MTGAFIGVPILIAILTICSTNENLRWISDLFGGDGAKRASLSRGSPHRGERIHIVDRLLHLIELVGKGGRAFPD